MSTKRIAVVEVVPPQAVPAAEPAEALHDLVLEPLSPLEVGGALVQPLEELAHQPTDRGLPLRGANARPAVDLVGNGYSDVLHRFTVSQDREPTNVLTALQPSARDGAGRELFFHQDLSTYDLLRTRCLRGRVRSLEGVAVLAIAARAVGDEKEFEAALERAGRAGVDVKLLTEVR